ncbi:sulfurtransferase complex subunit TusB [Vibrio rumoiensis]|uniref:Sulfur relay protein TusB n=1 Tax=Vibrio rumoiensis 1S-45 TaxID=1188252 RepID=A0A1E5E6H9_9VIBR|nr:sulfurtransferase complex subunit TusB [Vibrio rumoiensis]OEF30102.1 hypothetical protein A1QC_03690 [Vibrio rumoiensis 1S-45]
MLHIIKTIDAIEDSLLFSHLDDQFILVEDAVYGLISQKVLNGPIKDHLDHCYALAQDVQARGLDVQSIFKSQLVDFDAFVGLTEMHIQTMTWE